MANIIIDPMCLLSLSTYHDKNLPVGCKGASIGVLYAQQKELTYKISLSMGLGTSTNTPEEIINRVQQFENLRLRKVPDVVNHYEAYILIGWYELGLQKYCRSQKDRELLEKQFGDRGAPYRLWVDPSGVEKPKLYKDGKEVKFVASMDTLEKYCADSYFVQSSAKESALCKSLNKQKHLLTLYNEKLRLLVNVMRGSTAGEHAREVMEMLDMYQRMEVANEAKKVSIIEAMNYSVLSGLIIQSNLGTSSSS